MVRRSRKKAAAPETPAATQGVAMLVDGDNITPAVLVPLLARTSEPVTERRIWRNWRSTRDSRDWDAVSKELGFERVDRYNTRKEGKNASDIALAVGAMDLYHHGYRSFILVSGDTDFVPLVERLRRGGARVVMVGHHRDADLLHQVSDEYLAAPDLIGDSKGRGGRGGRSTGGRGKDPKGASGSGRKADEKSPKKASSGRGRSAPAKKAPASRSPDGPTKRQEKALEAALYDAFDACVAEGRDDEGWVSVDTLGKMVHAKNQGFTLSGFGYPSSMSLSDAYRSFKDTFQVHSMEAKGGNRMRYRVRLR